MKERKEQKGGSEGQPHTTTQLQSTIIQMGDNAYKGTPKTAVSSEPVDGGDADVGEAQFFLLLPHQSNKVHSSGTQVHQTQWKWYKPSRVPLRGLPPSAGATRKSCDSRPRTKVARSACLERETYHAMLSCGWAASLCVHPSGPPMFPSLAHTFLREKRPGGTGPGFNGSAACGPICASRQQLYRQIEYMCSQDRLLMFVSSGSGGSRARPIAFTHAYNSFTKRTCASRLARRISMAFFVFASLWACARIRRHAAARRSRGQDVR